jgi:hypothetical protein
MAGEEKSDRTNGRRNGAKGTTGAVEALDPSASAALTEAPPQTPADAPAPAVAPEAPSTATASAPEPSKEPRATRLLFISKWGLIHDLAWEVQKEGHEVRYHIMSKADREVGDGFVEKVDRWEDHKDWADVIVFDDCEFGALPDRLRKEGKAVVGGTAYTDKLEMDRDFGQEEMQAAGLTVLPRWEFDSFDAAVTFIKVNPGRYVVKPSGKAQNEKVLSFVGQEEDGLDVLMMLEHYKNGWASKIKSFQLQKYASGVEVAVGAFFNGKEFLNPIFVNFEHKRMFNDEIGPQTGEMGRRSRRWGAGSRRRATSATSTSTASPTTAASTRSSSPAASATRPSTCRSRGCCRAGGTSSRPWRAARPSTCAPRKASRCAW